MTTRARAALLIDADNFNDPDQLRAVHSQFTQRVGKGFACHAHGAVSVWQRAGFKDALADIGGRFMPGLPLDKNTTDANLIIDALMLHFQHGVQRFGIASGDADFAPLAVQLRELGCDVAAYARHAIAFERMVNYYDHVVRFDAPPTKPVPAPIQKPLAKLAPQTPAATPGLTVNTAATADAAPTPAAAVLPRLRPAPSPSPQVSQAPWPPSLAQAEGLAQRLATPTKAGADLPKDLARALQRVPALQRDKQSLALLVPMLKQAGLVGAGQGAGAKWLRQWPEWLRLSPQAQPNWVELTPKARLLVAKHGLAPAQGQHAVLGGVQSGARQQIDAAGTAGATEVDAADVADVASPPAPHAQALLTLGAPLMKRASGVPLLRELHAFRHVLHELAYSKITPQQVLQAAPELAQGTRVSLSSVAARLRACGLVQPSHSALRLLKHMPHVFEVQSANVPQWVRHTG